jgi:hypothetical protein
MVTFILAFGLYMMGYMMGDGIRFLVSEIWSQFISNLIYTKDKSIENSCLLIYDCSHKYKYTKDLRPKLDLSLSLHLY